MLPEIRTIMDLVAYVRSHVSSRACERAFTSGRIEVLGGFDPLSPSTQPGWLVRVTSRNGRVWLLGCVCELAGNQRYRFLELDREPWEHWTGGKNLYAGDDPVAYAEYRKRHEIF